MYLILSSGFNFLSRSTDLFVLNTDIIVPNNDKKNRAYNTLKNNGAWLKNSIIIKYNV